MRIGIIGAGLVAQGVAQLALKSGHELMLSNGRGPESLRDAGRKIGVSIGTVDEAVAFGDAILVAIPFSAIHTLPTEALSGKLVMDAANYYPERDGRIEELDMRESTTSNILARHLSGSLIVKAFNAILASDLVKDAKPAGSPGRRALPIAGDDAQAKQVVATLHDELGYDVVDAGPLSESWRFERAKPAYCVAFDESGLRGALSRAERDREVEEGSWRK
ncbi:NAD(P)-binding domain-containing protein [Bradyrhizobium sp. BR 10289]|uniref:NADPH-dependent F420 reductase n=1 Tax=Bradyrhizobium sp. BR 10289 TaxID=2749993 RepID=UPI001C646B55|nr:NAD(P)-binding domain-containing protein [Bradyrhizobium sp. BR 10289]MBW7970248.1 NAD(P)-binding domain-containing protein [Bradyrhizobium sp. BR 10289]